MQGVAAYDRSVPFWILRLLIAAIAALAVAEEASKPIIAINIGPAAPAILQLLTTPAGSGGRQRSLPNNNSGRSGID